MRCGSSAQSQQEFWEVRRVDADEEVKESELYPLILFISITYLYVFFMIETGAAGPRTDIEVMCSTRKNGALYPTAKE